MKFLNFLSFIPHHNLVTPEALHKRNVLKIVVKYRVGSDIKNAK